MNFARIEIEVDIAECHYAAKADADLATIE